MINVEDLPPGEHIYTFVGDDGENIHIASSRLRRWCMDSGIEPVLAPMNREVAETFLTDNVISVDRVRQMDANPAVDPVIMCKTGTFTNGNPDVVLADGHHRYYLQRNQALFLTYLLEREQWEQFRITGILSMTKDELREYPVLKRDYW